MFLGRPSLRSSPRKWEPSLSVSAFGPGSPLSRGRTGESGRLSAVLRAASRIVTSHLCPAPVTCRTGRGRITYLSVEPESPARSPEEDRHACHPPPRLGNSRKL